MMRQLGISASWMKDQSFPRLDFCAFGPSPAAFLSEDSGGPCVLPQIPGGLAVWQQCETSGRRHLSLQPPFPKGQLHCLQYSEKGEMGLGRDHVRHAFQKRKVF